MWIKYLANGSKITQGGLKKWSNTILNNIIRVDLVLPPEYFGNNNRVTLTGYGPYHYAVGARSLISGNTSKIAEYLQRFDGKNWLTIKADYLAKTIKQYILKNKLGV
jgi:hypothetical protein